MIPDVASASEPTAASIWDHGATALRSHLSEATWLTWFNQIRPLRLEDETLFLAVPSAVVRDRIASTYLALIHDVLREAVGEDLLVELVVEVSPRLTDAVAPPSDGLLPLPLDGPALDGQADGPAEVP